MHALRVGHSRNTMLVHWSHLLDVGMLGPLELRMQPRERPAHAHALVLEERKPLPPTTIPTTTERACTADGELAGVPPPTPAGELVRVPPRTPAASFAFDDLTIGRRLHKGSRSEIWEAEMPGHGKVAVKLFGEKAAAMAREASATSGSASTDATSSVVGGTFGSFAPSSTRIRRSTIRPQEHAPLMAGEAATRQMVDLNRKLMLLLETERAARLVAEAEAKRSAAKAEQWQVVAEKWELTANAERSKILALDKIDARLKALDEPNRLACEPGVVEPLVDTCLLEACVDHVSTLCAFSETCKTWRDAAAKQSIWRWLCIYRWDWLVKAGALSLGTIDWKQRFKTLSQEGECNAKYAFNLDDYEFFVSARALFPCDGTESFELLFKPLEAEWSERDASVYTPGDDPEADLNTDDVAAAWLKATLPAPFKLPNLHTNDDGRISIKDVAPIKLEVTVLYKPTGEVAHMVNLQIPDDEWTDFQSGDSELSYRVGVGPGTWDGDQLNFDDKPDWLGCIKQNHGACSEWDVLRAEAILEVDDDHRLTSIEFMLARNNFFPDEEHNDPKWHVPMHMADLAAVCKMLHWA